MNPNRLNATSSSNSLFSRCPRPLPAGALLVVFGALLLVLRASPTPATTTPPARPADDAYRIEVAITPAGTRLEGTMALRYGNRSARSLANVRLRLDPNLSSKQSLEIVQIEDGDGRPLPWTHQPLQFGAFSSDKGMIDVTLAQPIAPSGETSLVIHFRSTGNHLGPDMIVLQDDPFTSLDAWYPKAMTPSAAGWSIDDDRLADYDVSVRLPAEFTVCSTGQRGAGTTRDGQRELRLQARRVRGFTVYGSPRWQRHEKRTGDVALAVCLPAEAASWADRLLDAAADSIAFYEKEYAPFPARHLDIACPGSLGDRAHGSSAACNLITIFLGGKLEQQFRFLVAHEVAHQYFGTLVGFPRDSIGWVPVGLGLMMDEHCARERGFDAAFGPMMMRDFYLRAERMGFDTTLSQPVQAPLRSPPPWSFGWNMALAHGKAYAVCAMLRDLLGAEKFRDVIRTLLRERAGGLVREADLIAACENAVGGRLDWFVADWIDGRATFDYAIKSVEQTDAGWNVTVARLGTGSFPAWVKVTTKDGGTFRQRVDRAKAADVLCFRPASPVISARLNPDGIHPDLNPANDSWPPPPSGTPSRN